MPPPSPAERLHLEGKDYAKAERCLANAIYFEARSEPVRGQMAVAQVVMNRAFSGFYPNDVCGVVYQNAHRHLACQFTFACDGKSKAITERGAWARANRIAKQTLDGQIYVPEVAKSTHYHAIYVHPNWVREMKKMVRYGIHNFYRPYAWGNGAEEPVWGTAALALKQKEVASSDFSLNSLIALARPIFMPVGFADLGLVEPVAAFADILERPIDRKHHAVGAHLGHGIDQRRRMKIA